MCNVQARPDCCGQLNFGIVFFDQVSVDFSGNDFIEIFFPSYKDMMQFATKN